MMFASTLYHSNALVWRMGSRSISTRAVSAANVTLNPARFQVKGSYSSQHVDHSTAARRILEDDHVISDLAYCLSFATDESDFSKNYSQLFPDQRMKEQLANSKDQLRKHKSLKRKVEHLDTEPLPKTLQDALRPSRRAIVITEASKPFRIFDVNSAWEELCGYSFVESQGKTLGSLLQGPETDALAATALITQLLCGEEAGTEVTNYTKEGRPFRNRVRVGPLVDDDSHKVTHFVGVLQEV